MPCRRLAALISKTMALQPTVTVTEPSLKG